MKGTVALAVPPIRTGLRPSRAVIGAVRIEVTTPRMGGRPISAALESHKGSALRAAMRPPAQSPRNVSQSYLPVARIMAHELRHYFEKRCFELIHLFLSAHGDANIGWVGCPDAADVDLLFAHRQHRFIARPLSVNHEAVG